MEHKAAITITQKNELYGININGKPMTDVVGDTVLFQANLKVSEIIDVLNGNIENKEEHLITFESPGCNVGNKKTPPPQKQTYVEIGPNLKAVCEDMLDHSKHCANIHACTKQIADMVTTSVRLSN